MKKNILNPDKYNKEFLSGEDFCERIWAHMPITFT